MNGVDSILPDRFTDPISSLFYLDDVMIARNIRYLQALLRQYQSVRLHRATKAFLPHSVFCQKRAALGRKNPDRDAPPLAR